jgi:hypothetical protein
MNTSQKGKDYPECLKCVFRKVEDQLDRSCEEAIRRAKEERNILSITKGRKVN